MIEKLLWRAYRNAPTLFRTVPSSTPYGLPFPNMGGWVRNPNPKLQSLLSQERPVTDCKFGRYIHRVHPNKSPWKIWEKRERGRIKKLPNFWVPPIISGTGKATNFRIFYSIDRNKTLWKFSGKVAVGVLRDCHKFSGHPYIGRIARSSLR